MDEQSYIQTQQLLFTVSVYQEDCVLTDHSSSDAQFIVSGEELMKFFSSRIVFTPEAGMHWMVQDGQAQKYLLEIPETKVPFELGYRDGKRKEHIFKLQMPAMAFRFDVVQGSTGHKTINNIHGWCFRGKLKDNTRLYEIPLPNFSGSQFCVGTADKIHRHSLRETIEQTVFGSWFNTHWNNCGKRGLKLPDFIEHSKGKVRLTDCNRLGFGRDILSADRN